VPKILPILKILLRILVQKLAADFEPGFS